MRIELPNNFYLELTAKNIRLCERYEGRTKAGEVRDGIRAHGYYDALDKAIERYLYLNQLNGLQAVEIYNVGKLVAESNKDAVNKFKKILEGVKEG